MKTLAFKFVEAIPNDLEEGFIYISPKYETAVHLCCCGCRNEVVTPLSPTDWKLTFDGVSVSLYPSIGNWSFKCNSHYWIKNNKVQWARKWTQQEIQGGREDDQIAKKHFYEHKDPKPLSGGLSRIAKFFGW